MALGLLLALMPDEELTAESAGTRVEVYDIVDYCEILAAKCPLFRAHSDMCLERRGS